MLALPLAALLCAGAKPAAPTQILQRATAFSAPHTWARKTAELSAGQAIKVLQDAGPWLKVQFGPTVAWVPKSAVAPAAPGLGEAAQSADPALVAADAWLRRYEGAEKPGEALRTRLDAEPAFLRAGGLP